LKGNWERFSVSKCLAEGEVCLFLIGAATARPVFGSNCLLKFGIFLALNVNLLGNAMQ